MNKMLSRLFVGFQNRKLLVANAIVAIRNFASHSDEYGAALRQFYFAVHPDFFGQYPAEKETNENSLKVLNDFMSEVSSKNVVKPVTVNFFLRQVGLKSDQSSRSADAELLSGSFNQVEIQLKSQHLPTLVHDILSSCQLPIQEELEQLVRKQKEENHRKRPTSIKWSNSLKDLMDEGFFVPERKTTVETLHSWMLNNLSTARYRLEEIRPIVEENRRIGRRMVRRHRLKSFVGSDTGYSQITLNGALKQLEFLFKRKGINTKGLHGKTLKLGVFNGLDHLGRFIIDVTDIPNAWIQAVSTISDLDGLIHVLDLTEMQISEMLRGLQISRRRTQDPVPIKLYYKQASKLLSSLRESQYMDTMISPVLDKVRARITCATDHLSIDQDGVIIIPCTSTCDAISSFLRLNYPHIAESGKAHSRSLQAEMNSIDSCVEKLKLSSLKKDRIITSEQMIKSCERLKRETFLGLENMQLIISNYYGISGDGDIRIPWQWRK